MRSFSKLEKAKEFMLYVVSILWNPQTFSEHGGQVILETRDQELANIFHRDLQRLIDRYPEVFECASAEIDSYKYFATERQLIRLDNGEVPVSLLKGIEV